MNPNEYPGYRFKYKNPFTNNWVVVLDCKLAEQQGSPLVVNWQDEGGRYQVLCDVHSTIVHCITLRAAKETAQDVEVFCDDCREINNKNA
jgi:hypothetical protein